MMGRTGVVWILNLIERQNALMLRHGHGQGSRYSKLLVLSYNSRPRPGPSSHFGAGGICSAIYPSLISNVIFTFVSPDHRKKNPRFFSTSRWAHMRGGNRRIRPSFPTDRPNRRPDRKELNHFRYVFIRTHRRPLPGPG